MITKNALKHSRNPFKRLWRTKYPFRNYHYLIQYDLKENQINIGDILFDEQLRGAKSIFSAERTMLYEVTRTTLATYDKAKNEKGIEKLQGTWTNAPTATTQMNTAHAAVNGMQNDVVKAAWLMGTHLAAVLAQNNQQGKQVKWVAHSQGAIIFYAALEHYRIKYGKPLITYVITLTILCLTCWEGTMCQRVVWRVLLSLEGWYLAMK